MAMPMSKGSRGPVDSHQGRPHSTKKSPVGTDPKGIHPMTRKTGNKKMNRTLKGTDKRGIGKGTPSQKFAPGKSLF